MNNFELEELAWAVLGKSLDGIQQAVNDGDCLDSALFDEFEISTEQFDELISRLIKFTPVIKTAITGREYHAFVKDGLIICRQEIK